MKKKILIGLLLISVFLSTGCKKDNDFKLIIKESSWSGWSKDYEPEEVTNEYDVVLNKRYSINSGGLVFNITEIKDDKIVIETTKPFSDNEEGIDLRTKKTTFTIYLDEETALTTPTMDAGDIYYITLTK